MSEGVDNPQTLTLSANMHERRYQKNLLFWFTDVAVAKRIAPWMIMELVVACATYQFGVWLSPYKSFGQFDQLHIIVASLFSLSFAVTSLGLGHYHPSKRFGLGDIFRSTVICCIIATPIALTVNYLYSFDMVGRYATFFGTVVASLAILTIRILLSILIYRYPYRFTIIGKGPTVDAIAEHFRHAKIRSSPYILVPAEQLMDERGDLQTQLLMRHGVSDIILGPDESIDARQWQFAATSLQLRCRLVSDLDFFIQQFDRVPVDEVDRSWVLREGIAKRRVLGSALKRWFDIVVALTALFICAPLLASIALAIKLTSPGSVFFNQVRQGRYSKPFKMYKFRTMYTPRPKDDLNLGFTKKQDARVTSIGKILRPLHFDELPQFLNILKGDMSLVGPRPEAVLFADKMTEQVTLYDLRYLVRPGLTGHAQINQGYAMDTIDDTKNKLSYDLYYLCYYSLRLDLQIAISTVFYLSKGSR